MRRPDCEPFCSVTLFGGSLSSLRRAEARSSSHYYGHRARQPRAGSRPRSEPDGDYDL